MAKCTPVSPGLATLRHETRIRLDIPAFGRSRLPEPASIRRRPSFLDFRASRRTGVGVGALFAHRSDPEQQRIVQSAFAKPLRTARTLRIAALRSFTRAAPAARRSQAPVARAASVWAPRWTFEG